MSSANRLPGVFAVLALAIAIPHRPRHNQGAGAERGDAPPGTKASAHQPRELLQRHRMRQARRRGPPCGSTTPVCARTMTSRWRFYSRTSRFAYEVWRVVRQKQPAPTPSYPEAQRTHVTIGITPVRGSKNVLKDVVLSARPSRQPDGSFGERGRWTVHLRLSTFAATTAVTLDLTGQERTISCLIEQRCSRSSAEPADCAPAARLSALGRETRQRRGFVVEGVEDRDELGDRQKILQPLRDPASTSRNPPAFFVVRMHE